MKKKTRYKLKIYLRSAGISTVIIFCIIFGIMAAARAYENTVRIGYGIYRKAIYFDKNGLYFFDILIK